jgi:hypothetical protein
VQGTVSGQNRGDHQEELRRIRELQEIIINTSQSINRKLVTMASQWRMLPHHRPAFS